MKRTNKSGKRGSKRPNIDTKAATANSNNANQLNNGQARDKADDKKDELLT